MSASSDRQEDRDLVGCRESCVGSACGGVVLMCLLALVGLWPIESRAVADGGPPPAAADNSSLEDVATWLSQNPNVASSAKNAGNADGLTTETETLDDYKRIAAKSPYPATDLPQKLTLEQLETIAKLAPKSNTAGIRVHPALVPLFRSMVLRYTGGTYKNAPLHFRLHTPDNYEPGKKYPLVVWLHGAGECGADNINQLSHLHHMIPWLVGPKKRDFFLLAPQCPHTHVSWEAPEVCSTTVRPNDTVECHVVDDPVARGDAPIAFTLAMVDAVMKEFPIDPSRVSVGGLSTGGDGVWRMLERRPDFFAAAAPIVSWRAIHDKSLRDNPILKKVPIWAIYSSDDNGIDYARKEFERILEAGCNAHKTEFGVCGHRAWTPAMLQGDVFGWLISRGKDGNRFYVAESSPTSPEKIGIFADVTEGDLKRQPTKAVRPRAAIVARQPTAVAPTAAAGPRAETEYPYWSADTGRTSSSATISRAYAALPSTARPTAASVDRLRLRLIEQYIVIGEVRKALATADKVENREELVTFLLAHSRSFPTEVLDYVDRELDRMEQQGTTTSPPLPRRASVGVLVRTPRRTVGPSEEPLRPIPAGKKSPKEDCGKEWAMSTTTLYGLFADGWDQEANRVPDYIVNETGRQLRDRLLKAFAEDNLSAMTEFCNSFIHLDDIPLASPWFDTSGGRLRSRIKYTLTEKAKPVVDLLRDIAEVKAESKKEFVELAEKALKRIDAIVNPKTSD